MGRIGVFCSNDVVGRDPLFHPLFEGRLNVPSRIRSCDHVELAKETRARSAAAVLHSGHQVEADESFCLCLAKTSDNALVVIHCVDGRNGRVALTVIED